MNYDCTEIDPGVYVGGTLPQLLVRGAASVNGEPVEHASLFDVADFDTVVNLRIEHNDRLPPGRVQAYLWLPIHDKPPFPGVAWLDAAVRFVVSHRDAGHTGLIHCAAGVSRSGMVAVAYVMNARSMTAAAALSRVQAKRPCVSPNQAFMAGLLDYQTKLWCDGQYGMFGPLIAPQEAV